MKKSAKKSSQKRSKKSLKGAKYNVLKAKGSVPKKGLIALKKAHGKKLGVTCLICHAKLKYKQGRHPILCRKDACFKKMRCAYRYDWEALSPAFKKAA